MRIAVTNDIFKSGGAVGLLAMRFVQALLDSGHEATLICGVNEEGETPPNAIPSLTWAYPPRPGGVIGDLAFYRELRLRSAVAFRRWMEQGKADAWVCVVPPSGYGAFQVGGERIPYLYMANSPWAQEWLSAFRQQHGKEPNPIQKFVGVWPRRRLERKLVRGAAAWMALSATQLTWMAAEHGRCAGVKKHLIEGGVDCQEVAFLSSEERQRRHEELSLQYQVDPSIPWLVCSRRLVPRTGVRVLLEALAILDHDCHLFITGDGPDKPSLQKRAEDLGVAHKTTFTGVLPFSDLMSLVAVCEYSLLPTQELEGFGLSAAEAFAAGTPVIATPVGALSDVVGTFDMSCVSSGLGAEDIASKLREKLDSSPRQAEETRQRAREYALSRFDWAKHKSAFVEAVEGIAHKANPT